MEKKIQELYEDISFLGFTATYSRNNTYARNSRDLIPKLQEFVQWFLSEVSGLEEGIYANLLDILYDCERALQENDNVLMMDALEQGIAGYLEMFLTEDYFKEKETVYAGGTAGEKSESAGKTVSGHWSDH